MDLKGPILPDTDKPNNGNGKTLSTKQQRFVEEYCKDWNATQAAIRAGYAPISAHVAGCRLLSVDKVDKAIEAHRATLTAQAEISAEYVLRKIRGLAEKCYEEESKAWNPHVSAKCLEMLGKNQGVFEADNLQRDQGTSIQILQFNPNASNTGELPVSGQVAVVHSDSLTPCTKPGQDVIEGELAPTEEDDDQ